jgi:hypothetical protein
MTEARRLRGAAAACVLAACGLLLTALPATARELAVGFLSLADDPRNAPQVLAKGLPQAPT